MKNIIITSVLLTVSSMLFSYTPKPGAFAEPGLARPASLGNAFVSVADDANAVIYNPAGMLTSKWKDFTFLHYRQKGIIPYNYALFVYPLNPLRAVGAGLIVSGDEIFDEKTFMLSYAENIDRFTFVLSGLSVGANLKMQFAGFGDKYTPGTDERVKGNAWGMGIDFGALWKLNEFVSAGYRVRDAFSWLNWNTNYSKYAEGVPLTSAFGLSYRNKEFLISADMENLDRVCAGAEVTIFKYVALRGGYMQELTRETEKEYSAGLGIGNFEFGPQKNYSFAIDAAYSFEKLDNTMKIQAYFRFK